jgi:pyruvate/oxaloacetate carboxyltransferase
VSQTTAQKSVGEILTSLLGFRGDIGVNMPTIEEIKELLKRVKEKSQFKKQIETSRPSPLPPMSPFTHVRDIVRERDADNKVIKSIQLTDEIVKNIQKAGH